MTSSSPTQKSGHSLQKFLWPAMAFLAFGAVIISFLGGAVYGKNIGQTRASASWFNATRATLKIMHDLDNAPAKRDQLSSMIRELDERLLLDSPDDADLTLIEVAKKYLH